MATKAATHKELPKGGDVVGGVPIVDPSVSDSKKELTPSKSETPAKKGSPVGTVEAVKSSLKALVEKALGVTDVKVRHEKQSVNGPKIEATLGENPFATVRLVSPSGVWKEATDFTADVYAFLNSKESTALSNGIRETYGIKSAVFNR